MTSYESTFAFQHTKSLDGFEELLSPQTSSGTMDPSCLSFSSTSSSPFAGSAQSQPTSIPPSRSRSPRGSDLFKTPVPAAAEDGTRFLGATPWAQLAAAAPAAQGGQPDVAGSRALAGTAPALSTFAVGSYGMGEEGDRRTSVSASDLHCPSSHHSHSTSTSSSLWSSSVYDGLTFPSSDAPFLPHGVSGAQDAIPSSAVTTYNFALQAAAAQNASAPHPSQTPSLHSQQQHQQTDIRIDTSSLAPNMQFASPYTPLAAQLQQTKLFSPFGTDMNADSPTVVTPGTAVVTHANGFMAPHPQTSRRPGAVRTVSAIDLPRQRNGAPANGNNGPGGSPATPTIVGFNPYPYPYPSPLGAVGVYKSLGRRPSVPILHSAGAAGGFTHLNLGVNGQSVSPIMPGQGLSPNALRAAVAAGANGTQKRVHPLPSGLSEEFLGWDQSGMGHDDGLGQGDNNDPRKKPPRFRPSKEQLDILIASYQQNKNPDAKTREALAKMLGGNIKPKTLQIWFQNRRSKARAKERDAMNPKALAVTTTLDLSRGRRPSVEAELQALRALARSTDNNLVVLPVSVMSMSRWTRFLTPGSGRTRPDLGCALDLRPTSPGIALYVVHSGETYRLSLSLSVSQPNGTSPTGSGGAVVSVQAAENPQLQNNSVAVRLEVRPGKAAFAMWSAGSWRPVGDFSGGVVSAGGRLELTGDREMMLNAFTQVRQLISGNGNDAPLSAAPLSAAVPTAQSVFPKDWQFPNTATSAQTQAGAISASPVSSSDARGQAIGLPPSIATLGLGPGGPGAQTSLSASAGASNPMSSVFNNAQTYTLPGTDRHQRKRSCSAPTVPAFDPLQLIQNGASGPSGPAVPSTATVPTAGGAAPFSGASSAVMFSQDLAHGAIPSSVGANATGSASAESSASMLFPMDDWHSSSGLADLPEEPSSAALNEQWMMASAAMYGAGPPTGAGGVSDLDALGLFTQTFDANAVAGGSSGSSQGSRADTSTHAAGVDVPMQDPIEA